MIIGEQKVKVSLIEPKKGFSKREYLSLMMNKKSFRGKEEWHH